MFAQWLVAPVMRFSSLILYYGEDKSDVLLPACERKKRGKRGRNKPVRGKTTDGDFVAVFPSRV
jgi:hypothetical protein